MAILLEPNKRFRILFFQLASRAKIYRFEFVASSKKLVMSFIIKYLLIKNFFVFSFSYPYHDHRDCPSAGTIAFRASYFPFSASFLEDSATGRRIGLRAISPPHLSLFDPDQRLQPIPQPFPPAFLGLHFFVPAQSR